MDPCIGNDGKTLSFSCDDPRHLNLEDQACTPSEEAARKMFGPYYDNPNPSDNDVWDFVTKGTDFAPGLVRVLVYVDIGGGYDHTKFNGQARVCLETKGGQFGDASSCQEGIETGGNLTSHVPFAVPEQPDDDEGGVYLPKGKPFNVCVQIAANGNDHAHNCVEGRNDGSGSVIGVHVPFE